MLYILPTQDLGEKARNGMKEEQYINIPFIYCFFCLRPFLSISLFFLTFVLYLYTIPFFGNFLFLAEIVLKMLFLSRTYSTRLYFPERLIAGMVILFLSQYLYVSGGSQRCIICHCKAPFGVNDARLPIFPCARTRVMDDVKDLLTAGLFTGYK